MPLATPYLYRGKGTDRPIPAHLCHWHFSTPRAPHGLGIKNSDARLYRGLRPGANLFCLCKHFRLIYTRWGWGRNPSAAGWIGGENTAYHMLDLKDK